jgi:hypothetical protein
MDITKKNKKHDAVIADSLRELRGALFANDDDDEDASRIGRTNDYSNQFSSLALFSEDEEEYQVESFGRSKKKKSMPFTSILSHLNSISSQYAILRLIIRKFYPFSYYC